MTCVKVLYFASLRDSAGVASESVDTSEPSLGELYDSLRSRHRFALPSDRLRGAVDGVFARWSDIPCEGSEIAFIPPVSGG